MKQSKTILAVSSVALLLLSACNGLATVDDGDDSSSMSDHSDHSESSASGPFLDDEGDSSSDGIEFDVSSTASSASQAAASSVQAGQTRVIAIDVTNWSFSPAMISVKKGEKVRLQITGGDGIHSFAVPGLSMNVRIEPGKTVTVDLPTDVAGTFEVRCAIPCGAGHRDMKATIVIS